jgi:hypothetical protein
VPQIYQASWKSSHQLILIDDYRLELFGGVATTESR